MNNKYQKILEDMKGRTFQYGTNIHYVTDFRIDEQRERCVIKTNISSYDRPFDGMNDFLKFWKPVSNMASIQTEVDQNMQVAIFREQEDSLSNRLIEILNDNIEKVQTDKSYIPQATAINNNINTIVNIAKMRLACMKQFKTALARSPK